MIRIIKENLGVKLFLLLTAVVILAVAPITCSSLHTLSGYGDRALEIHSDHITSQTRSSLRIIAREKAAHYQNHFDRIAASAAMLGSQATAIYSNIGLYAEKPLHGNDLFISPITGNFINDLSAPVTTIYWGDPQISPVVDEELRALSHLTPLFTRVLKENPEVLASHSITASGIGLYCTVREHYKKAAAEIPPPSVFDLRQGEPMTIFSAGADRLEDVRWTSVYKDDVIDGFMLTASAPVYDDSGQFRAIAGIDVPLADVVDDILTADSPEDEKWLLFSFLLDSDGRIIAFPEKFFKLFGIEHNPSEYQYSSDRLDILLGHSKSREVRNLTTALLEKNEHQQKTALEGENYYVITSRMPKHQWIFGVVARESDMLESVTAGRGQLDQTIRNLAIHSVGFSLATIAIALVVIFLLLRFLITPLRRLSLATEQVAAGNLDVQCPVTTGDEPGILAASFNSMVIQLRTAKQQQQLYSDSLENQVAQRNEQVIRQKRELENSLKEKEVLLREIHHRTKNNMLIIISMLELQRQELHEEQQRTIFKEMENRIRSMALVHEKLYTAGNLTRIDMGSYLNDVARSLLSSMVIDGRIALDLQAEPISIDIDHAVPIGLVANEIITNAIIHAFPQGRQGTITIALKRCQNNYLHLTLADDGIGLPKDVDILATSSFGTGIIIAGLVKMQLKGEITVERHKGTTYHIRFLDPILHKRL